MAHGRNPRLSAILMSIPVRSTVPARGSRLRAWMDGWNWAAPATTDDGMQWRVFFAPTQRSAGGKRKRTHLVSNDSDDANDEANKANERREQTQDILSSKRDSGDGRRGRRKIPSISSTITAACASHAFESLFPGRPPLPLVGAVVVIVLLLLNCVTNNSYFPKDRFRPN